MRTTRPYLLVSLNSFAETGFRVSAHQQTHTNFFDQMLVALA